ncbi:MAG: hypothetical protein NTV30_09580 [Chloroflexi bacterium]|nr:hypothetical protein [Chloroflexota bacterium]
MLLIFSLRLAIASTPPINRNILAKVQKIKRIKKPPIPADNISTPAKTGFPLAKTPPIIPIIEKLNSRIPPTANNS